MQLNLRRLLTPPPADPDLHMAGALTGMTISMFFVSTAVLLFLTKLTVPVAPIDSASLMAGVWFLTSIPLVLIASRIPRGFSSMGIAPHRLTMKALAGGGLIWVGTGVAIWFPLFQAYFAGLKYFGISCPPQPVFKKVATEVAGGAPNLVLIFLVVLALPFFEELIFRGLLLSFCRKYLPRTTSILVTALLFGVMHCDPLIAIFPTFLLGVIFGYARERTGSIWGAWSAHAMHNGVTVLFSPHIIRLYDAG